MLPDYKTLVNTIHAGVKHPVVIWISPYGRDGTALTFACTEDTYDTALMDGQYGQFLRWSLNRHLDVMSDLDPEYTTEIRVLLESGKLDLGTQVSHSQRKYGHTPPDSEDVTERILKEYAVSKPMRDISGAIIIK